MARRHKDYICFIFGVLLILVGALGFVYPEITLKRTKIIKLSPISVEKPQKQVFTILPYAAGGIQINANGGTSVPGLYSAGEVTGGVHGRNRLMGNSLLDILVFGRRAGMNAAEYIKKFKVQSSKFKLTLEHVEKFEKELKAAGVKESVVGPMILPEYTPDHVKKRQWGTAV